MSDELLLQQIMAGIFILGLFVIVISMWLESKGKRKDDDDDDIDLNQVRG